MGFGRGGTSDLPNLENIPDRPPSSASEIPPLIPPPIEFVRTEQEAHGHGARGSYVVNPSLL